MDNQQATKQCSQELELAWLAGFLEGEGSLMLRAQARSERALGNKVPKIETQIRIYNTDARLIRKCIEIIRGLDIEPNIEERIQKPMPKRDGGEYRSVDPMLAIKIAKPTLAHRFLTRIRPYLYGQKADRADLMLEYLTRRLQRIEESGKDPRGVPLDQNDFDVVKRFQALTRPGKKALAESSTSYEQNTA